MTARQAPQHAAPRASSSKRSGSVLYLVKQLESALRVALEDILRPSGVTALQYTALTVLDRTPDMSQADLARHSFVRVQSAADLVAALESQGMITRAADPTHKRRLVISLTPAGRDFLACYDPQVAALEERIFTGTDAGTRQLMGEGMRRLRDRLRTEISAGAGRPLDDTRM